MGGRMSAIVLNDQQLSQLKSALNPYLAGQTVMGGIPIMLNRLQKDHGRLSSGMDSITESLYIPGGVDQYANLGLIAISGLDEISVEIFQAFHSHSDPHVRLDKLRQVCTKTPKHTAAVRQSLLSIKHLAFVHEHLMAHSPSYEYIHSDLAQHSGNLVRDHANRLRRGFVKDAAALDALMAEVTSHHIERMTNGDWPPEWTLDAFFDDVFSAAVFFSIIDAEDVSRIRPKSFCNLESLIVLSLCSQYMHLTTMGIMATGIAVRAYPGLKYTDEQGRILELKLDSSQEVDNAEVH